MKVWICIACAALSTLLLSSCVIPGNVRHDVRGLQKISPLYFDLKRSYPAGEYEIKTWTNKIFPSNVGLCKGRYIATLRDRSGTYFSPPKECDIDNGPSSTYAIGIWVPDNPQKDGYDTWYVIQRAKTSSGFLIDALDSLETGDFKRGSIKIVTQEIIDDIQVKPLQPQ